MGLLNANIEGKITYTRHFRKKCLLKHAEKKHGAGEFMNYLFCLHQSSQFLHKQPFAIIYSGRIV